MTDQCRQIALDHVDMMFHFYATLGYPLSLNLKPRWDVHLSCDDDQLGYAGESLSPYLENDPAPSFAPTICAFHLGFSLGCVDISAQPDEAAVKCRKPRYLVSSFSNRENIRR